MISLLSFFVKYSCIIGGTLQMIGGSPLKRSSRTAPHD